ncbi:MAG: tRNA (guanosine(37)-N1)-methyltransferase TrmD [Balneolaceae bacterium]
MLRIDLISAVPGLLESPLSESIIGRARSGGHADIRVYDLREYSKDKHRKIDDYPYGGEAGMVLTPQPIFDCIESIRKENPCDEIIFTAPDAEPFKQVHANELSLKDHIVILCGHYKGVDQRVREALVTREFSFGDFVLSGGEIPALAITDAVVRLIPGVLGDAESALNDSFQDSLLSAPVYTRPAEFRGLTVPDILRSGNHAAVEEWRRSQALERTREIRPDLFEKRSRKK